MSQSAIYDSLQNKFPHYRKGDVLLIHADCMDVMSMMPDKAVDLAVVDPPYGIGRDGGETGKNWKLYKKKYWDTDTPKEEYFSYLFKKSINQIIWGGNYFSNYLPSSMGWIFWDKGQDLTMSDGELAFSSFNRALRRIIINRCEIYKNSVLIHPTQKPLKLYSWLYANYAKPNQLIFDSHGGSFSSAIAAHYSGVRFIGCELDEDYYRAAVERFKQATSQVDIFA